MLAGVSARQSRAAAATSAQRPECTAWMYSCVCMCVCVRERRNLSSQSPDIRTTLLCAKCAKTRVYVHCISACTHTYQPNASGFIRRIYIYMSVCVCVVPKRTNDVVVVERKNETEIEEKRDEWEAASCKAEECNL